MLDPVLGMGDLKVLWARSLGYTPVCKRVAAAITGQIKANESGKIILNAI